MVDPAQHEKRLRAATAYVEWLKKADDFSRLTDDLRQLYEEAGDPLPPAVAAFTSGVPATRPPQGPRMVVTAPEPPPRPHGAEKDWIWVQIEDLSMAAVVFGILRELDDPIQPPELFKRVQEYHPEARNEGSLLNIGLRWDGEVIERTEAGWKIIDRSRAPILFKGYGWGPVGIFLPQEVAAHRRLLVLHVLRAAGPKGLGTMEIARKLLQADFCRVPVGKDLIKMDMVALEGERKVRKVGHTRNWGLTGMD